MSEQSVSSDASEPSEVSAPAESPRAETPSTAVSDDPPRPGRHRVAFMAAGVLLAVLVAGGSYAWIRTSKARAIDRTRAAATRVDERLDEAWIKIEDLDRKWATVESDDDPSTLAPLMKETTTTIAAVVAAVKEASSTIASVEHTQVAGAYGSVLSRMQTVLEASLETNEGVGDDMRLYALGETLDGLVAEGYDKMDAAVRDCNKRDFAAGRRDAAVCKQKFTEALAVARQYHELDGDFSDYNYVEWTTELVKYADMQATLAKLGGRTSAYNAQISKLRKQQAKIADMDIRFTRGDVVWQDIKGQNGQLAYMLRSARKEWDAAKALVLSGTF